MKRIIILAVLFIAVLSTVFAQDGKKKKQHPKREVLEIGLPRNLLEIENETKGRFFVLRYRLASDTNIKKDVELQEWEADWYAKLDYKASKVIIYTDSTVEFQK